MSETARRSLQEVGFTRILQPENGTFLHCFAVMWGLNKLIYSFQRHGNQRCGANAAKGICSRAFGAFHSGRAGN